MPLVATIAGTDRASFIQWNSLLIENTLTNQLDQCFFTIRNRGDKILLPTAGQEVIITLDGTRVFGGTIVRVNEVSPMFGTNEFEVICADYTRLMDRKLVAKVYEKQTINDIIADLLTNFMPSDFTIVNVDASVTVQKVVFNYIPVSEVLTDLAKLVNYDWYVDYNKDVHFFAKKSVSAPFEITDTNGNVVHDSLKIRRDATQIRTSIIVRGGEYLGATVSAALISDGSQRIFNLPYRFSNFKATLTGKLLNVGIDSLNSEDDHDALHNFQEKTLIFKDVDKPSEGATLTASGNPNLPVIVKYKAESEIATLSAQEGGDGEAEYLIIDKSIESREAARERARAEIIAYGETLSEGSFKTETAGLVAGQVIRINSATRNFDEEFIINRVISRMFDSNTMKYDISLITTRTFGMIELLRRLILEDTRRLVIDDNETVDLIQGFVETISFVEVVVASISHNPQLETMTFDETFTAQSLNFGTEFVLGRQNPSGSKRTFILGGSRIGRFNL